MVIKSIISKIKSSNKKSNDAPGYTVKIKEVKPVDNIVDDFFSEIDANGGADNE